MPDKTVIVTGASRGLGGAAVRILASMGARVVLNARSADDLATVAGDIREAGGEALPVAGDISQPDVCQRLVGGALDHFGGVDAVVNNAGVIEPIAAIADGDPAAWETNWAINVLGPVLLTQAALPHLRQCAGRVVNVSSGAAVSSTTGWAAYCVAKAALNMFNSALAAEEKTITAIALRPGLVDTTMQTVIRRTGSAGMSPEDHARFLRYHEAGDLRPPEMPGRALAVLALHAPREWSGAFMSWDDAEVQALVKRHG